MKSTKIHVKISHNNLFLSYNTHRSFCVNGHSMILNKHGSLKKLIIIDHTTGVQCLITILPFSENQNKKQLQEHCKFNFHFKTSMQNVDAVLKVVQ